MKAVDRQAYGSVDVLRLGIRADRARGKIVITV
jgi:hypothetical protein